MNVSTAATSPGGPYSTGTRGAAHHRPNETCSIPPREKEVKRRPQGADIRRTKEMRKLGTVTHTHEHEHADTSTSTT